MNRPQPRPRTITLRATFTKERRHAVEPEPITGLFYGRTKSHWFIRVDGETQALPILDWEEAR